MRAELSLRTEARTAQRAGPDHDRALGLVVRDDAVAPRREVDAGAADVDAVDRRAHHAALAENDVGAGDGDIERCIETVAQRPELGAPHVQRAPRHAEAG